MADRKGKAKTTAPEPARPAPRWLWCLPPLSVVIVVAPLLLQGFPLGHDWDLELARIAEYGNALASGQFPPYWAENLYEGYGSPVFLFYAPAYSLVASLLVSILHSLPSGASLAIFLFTLVGAVGTYCLMSTICGSIVSGDAARAGARMAVYLYLLNPYLVGNALLRNAGAEYAGLCLLPLPLLGLLLLRRSARLGISVLAAGLALVILAHNLTALVAASLVAVLLPGWFLRGREAPWIGLATGSGLGLMIASFLWLPAMTLQPLIRIEQLLADKFDFRLHFQSPVSAFGYEQFHGVGLLPPFLLVAAAWLTLRHGRPRDFLGSLTVAVLSAALLFVFLQQPASTFVWESIPYLPYFQFPWRFMGPLALAIAIAGGAALARSTDRPRSSSRSWIELGLFLLCVANATPHLMKVRPLDPEAVRAYRHLAPEEIRDRRLTVTVLDEYLPREARLPLQRPGASGVVRANAEVEVVEDSASRLVLDVKAEEKGRIALARWSFPVWRCRIDGLPADTQSSSRGLLEVPVPPGTHRVELELSAPAVRKLANGLSLGGILCWFLVLSGRPLRLWAGSGRASRSRSSESG